MKPFALLLPLLSLVTGSAHADDGADRPFYAGTAVGHASLDRGSLSLSGANGGGINGTDTALTLFGGYEFDPHFGVEVGYHDYGTPAAFQQTGFSVNECPASFSCPAITGLTAELLGRIELVPDLDGVLRLGVLAWHVGSPGSALLRDTSGNAFIYGLGVRRHFGDGWSFDITYEHSNFTTEETRLGVSYSF
jgi:OOP family OmpA-OmpF porin